MNCTVVISGEEDEVIEAAVTHAVTAHADTDTPQLRDELRAALRDEEQLLAERGCFIQLIEFRTKDRDQMRELEDKWREQIGPAATARWALVTADRDRPDTYLQLVGFPDYASAMRNSEHPATSELAKKMQEVTEGEANFRNLDVRDIMRM